MSKADRNRKRSQRRAGKPSVPRVIGANDNTLPGANDDMPEVVVRGVVLTPTQAARLAHAEANLADADLGRRRMGRDQTLALDAEIDAKVQEARRRADLDETLTLEARRGSSIEVSDRQEHRGRVRITSRDGLETLLTAHSITTIQHAAGLRYRDDYEAIDPEKQLTPPSIDQSRNISRGGDGYALKRREIEERVRDLEKMIQEEDRTFKGANGRTAVERTGRAVWALREIAGKGSNLRSLTNSGSVQASISAALILALDCAAVAYGLE